MQRHATLLQSRSGIPNWRSRADSLLASNRGMLALLVLLPLVLHLPELLGWLQTDPRLLAAGAGANLTPGLLPGVPGWLDPNSLWTTESLGRLAARQWLSGHVPWWNSYSGVGAPLAAEMQPAALFLPFILLMHFSTGLLWMRIAMQAIAGVGAFRLLQSLRLHPAACLLGSIMFAFTGTLSWFSHGPDRVAAFLPWMIFGIEFARIRRLRGAAIFAVALPASIYAGFPESAYINGLLALAWFAVRLAQDRRLAFAACTIGGGLVGLMFAAPAIVPFLDYLKLGDVGGHGGGTAWSILPGPALAMLLMPYIAGPIAAFGTAPGSTMFAVWGSVGGYFGATVTTLAIAGFANGRREAGLRLMLFGWIMLALCKSAGVPGVVQAMNLIPLIGTALFSRYMEASVALAGVVLGALAIDAWLTGIAWPRRRWIAASTGMALAFASLLLIRKVIPSLLQAPGYAPFLIFSIGWCLLVILAISVLLAGPATRPRAALLGVILLADTLGMSGLTLLSAPRGNADTSLLDFLAARPCFDRVLALGRTIGLNDGAGHGFAAINETMLPTPISWNQFLRGKLHPPGDAISFPDTAMDIDDVAADLDAYQAMGVTLLAIKRSEAPAHALATAALEALHTPRQLDHGESLTGFLPAGFGPQALTDRIAVDIGTYRGASDGSLRLQLCHETDCAEASAPLTGAADNAALDFVLNRKLPFGGPSYRWILHHDGGTHPVAIWLVNGSTAPTDDGGNGPRFSMRRVWPNFDPKLVFANKTAEIYEIPSPAPYFEAAGCALVPQDRVTLAVNCPAPSVLLRRELFFPGWQAHINAMPINVAASGIFQSIPLPAGQELISFTYAPLHIAWAWAAAAIALILIATAWVKGKQHHGCILIPS